MYNSYAGAGYKLGQELSMCGGCIILNCTSRPCIGRHGEKCELFWNLGRISEHCCQDCKGKVLAPNQKLPPVSLHDECDTTEEAVCKALWHSQRGKDVGTLVVSYTTNQCCDGESVGSMVIEPQTCSYRRCTEGFPAFRERINIETRYVLDHIFNDTYLLK